MTLEQAAEFIEQMARFTTPEEEFEDHKLAYPSVDEYIADMDDERLCGEYSTFMEMVRKAKAIIAEPATVTEFSVHILWGNAPEPGDTPTTHTFASQALLDAFMEGVEAASGWLDHEVVDDEATNEESE